MPPKAAKSKMAPSSPKVKPKAKASTPKAKPAEKKKVEKPKAKAKEKVTVKAVKVKREEPDTPQTTGSRRASKASRKLQEPDPEADKFWAKVKRQGQGDQSCEQQQPGLNLDLTCLVGQIIILHYIVQFNDIILYWTVL